MSLFPSPCCTFPLTRTAKRQTKQKWRFLNQMVGLKKSTREADGHIGEINHHNFDAIALFRWRKNSFEGLTKYHYCQAYLHLLLYLSVNGLARRGFRCAAVMSIKTPFHHSRRLVMAPALLRLMMLDILVKYLECISYLLFSGNRKGLWSQGSAFWQSTMVDLLPSPVNTVQHSADSVGLSTRKPLKF